jgi:hypothetical protein
LCDADVADVVAGGGQLLPDEAPAIGSETPRAMAVPAPAKANAATEAIIDFRFDVM